MTNAAIQKPSVEQIWSWLGEVADPELPFVSVVDLGIVREVAWKGEEQDACVVTITPTYSGCPAIAAIERDIRAELEKHGMENPRLEVRLRPPWTTDWLSPEAAEKLRAFGIAPPASRGSQQASTALPIIGSSFSAPREHPACPHCGSTRTTLISQFGSTLCKAIYRCHDCLEPFDYFKCH